MAQDFLLSLPLLLATLWIVLLIVVEAYIQRHLVTKWLTLLGFFAVGAATLYCFPHQGFAFNEMIRFGAIQHFVNLVFLLAGILVTLISDRYLEQENIWFGEYYIVMFVSILGMMLMASAAHLSVLFIGLETMSIALYVLAGLMRRNLRSNEAAMKYFLLGSFASGFFLYGISLIYGATGEMALHRIADMLQVRPPSVLFWIGLSLLMIGLFFKISAVPFHQWTPDVYEGAPTPASAFMSTGAKAAAFAALISVASSFSGQLQGNLNWSSAVSVIAVASMVVGNVAALAQDNLKRMLAYSSIAHAGYMLVGIAAGGSEGYSAVMYYTLVYTLMNLGAFGVIALLEAEGFGNAYRDCVGLFKKSPLLAGTMAVFMLSLTGLPPFAGFVGKYKVFVAAVSSGIAWLAMVGVLASAISAYYYLRVVVSMFMQESEPISDISSTAPAFTLALVALAILLLGIFPTEVLKLTSKAIELSFLP
ncbi:MAG: NADH-quinone oxidoreductase subunit N [Chloroherpetonaceae bacterium]|nr:NADH-quinone oxidoreductase subunit N [Chloroherpetonaceae bacterium]MCS7210405.1 NADH-quinone oxidoreductase subunit N [Chloroherpetonaceae bacterium]MDW8019276.1 NADH-quinone oxidoreductase subunit N [Chloroherpetonaceae bacterium]